MKSPKNIPASVRQRLLNRAKNDKKAVQRTPPVLCHGTVSVPPVPVSACGPFHPQLISGISMTSGIRHLNIRPCLILTSALILSILAWCQPVPCLVPV